MSVDLASLVLKIDSTSVDKGKASLDELSDAGKRSQVAADGATAAWAKTTKEVAAQSAASRNATVALADLANQHQRLQTILKDRGATDEQQKFLLGMRQKIDLFGKSASEAKVYEAAMMGIKGADLDSVKAMATQHQQMERNAAMWQTLSTRMVWAAGAAATALVGFTFASIQAGDAMNDMHLRTGLAFKELAAYDLLARQSGTSLEGVSQGFKFLGKYMTEHGDKLKKLGIDTKDQNVAMGQFADVIVSIKDPALRSTLAMEVLGRGGMALLPMLMGGSKAFEEARRASDAYGKSLEVGAPLSDQFNDIMAQVGTNTKTAGMNVVTYLGPGLIGMATWMKDITSGGESAAGAADFLAEKVEGIVKWVPPLQGMLLVLRGIAALMPESQTEIDARKIKSGQLRIGKLPPRGLSDEEELALGDKTSISLQAEKAAREIIEGQKKASAKDASIAKTKQMIDALQKESEQLGANAIQTRMLTVAHQALTLKTDEQRMAVMTAAAAWATAAAAQEQETEAAKISEAAGKFKLKMYEDTRKAMQDAAKSVDGKIAKLNEETAAMTMTADQLREHIILRDLEKTGLDKSSEAYGEMTRRYREALSSNEMAKQAKKGAEEAARVWEKFGDDISRGLTDALMRGFDDGKSFAENFLDSVQATFKTAALKIAVQMVMDPISGSLKGILGGATGIGGIGGGLSGLFGNSGSIMDTISTGGSLYNLATGNVAGGMYGAFAGSSMGASLGLSVPGLMGPTTSGAALSGLTGLGTMLPYLGIGLGALSLLGGFGDDGPTERSASVTQWGNVNGYVGEYGHTSAIGGFTPWANNRWFSESEMWASQKAFGDQLVALDNKIAAAMTADQLAAAQAALQADAPTTVGFGTEHTDWRSSGADEFIMTERYQIILNAMQSGLGDLAAQGGITAAEVEQAIAWIQAAKQAEIDAKEAIVKASTKAADDSAKEAQRAADAQLEAQRRITEGWQRVADSILETINKLRGEMGTPNQNFAQAQADFFINTAAARSGNQEAAGRLPELARAVVDLGRTVSTTSVEQNMLTARTIASLRGTVKGMEQFGVSLPSFDVGTDFVPRDMVAKIHKGEKITPERYNAAGGSKELIEEIRALRAEVAALRSATSSTSANTRKTSDILQRVTRDGNSLLTEVAV